MVYVSLSGSIMKRIGLISVVVTLILNANAATAADRPNSSTYTYWFDIGILSKSMGEEFNGYGSLSKISWSNNRYILMFRNLGHNDGPNIIVCIAHALFASSCDRASNEIADEALLFGRKLENTNLSLSAGIGGILNDDYGSNSDTYYKTTGLALDMTWRFMESAYIGSALNVSANINNEDSIVGVFLTFNLGKLQ